MKIIIAVCSLFVCVLTATHEDPHIFATREIHGTVGGPVMEGTEEMPANTAGTMKRSLKKDCPKEYKQWSDAKGLTHTMCDSKYDPDPAASGTVTKQEMKEIVNKHNELRSDPKTTETAKQMCKLYWDKNIAKIAQHMADSCPTYGEGHDKNRNVPGYNIYTGQNLAWGFFTWDAAIQAWFNEVKDFAFGQGSINGKAVGHYTQIVKDTTCRIGCGYAQCGHTKTYVCNYATGQSDYTNPFKPGKPCEGCKKCSNNLCDCGGKMCYSGGTLDYNTCTCSCTDLYSGDSCETLNCKSDKSYCGKEQPYGYPASFCKYTNVPGECPVMCGVCKDGDSAGDGFIPAPATKLISGDGKKGSSFAKGNVGKSNTGGKNNGSTNGKSGGSNGGKSGNTCL